MLLFRIYEFPSLSLTVLHTGKRWFIICPVAETPTIEDEKTASHASASQGMFGTYTATSVLSNFYFYKMQDMDFFFFFAFFCFSCCFRP